MSEWEFTTIGNICDLTDGTVQTGPFGSDLHASDYSLTGTPVIMPANLRKNGIVEDGIARVSDDHVERLSNHQLILNDIVFPRRGDVSRYAIITDRYRGWLCGTGCLRIRFGENGLIDPVFLGYWLGTDTVEQWLLSNAVGTTMPNLNTSILKALPIPLPPLPEQRAIAEVLGSLDDKIEANRRQNATLEATARAIFKSWFVDFDPVHARARGEQPPGMDAATAAIFPDSFEESELGSIPSGWRVGCIADIAEMRRDSVKPQDFPVEIFFHFSIPAFSEGQMPTVEAGEKIKSNKYIIPPDSVLLSKLNPRFPKIWLPIVQNIYRSICSTEFLVNIAKKPCTRAFLYSLFQSKSFYRAYAQLVTGTSSSHQRVKPQAFQEMTVIIPSADAINAFTHATNSMFDKISINLLESRTLAETRDALLPRLVSGELRVGEINQDSVIE